MPASTLVIEVSNGVIALITGVTLYGINRMFRWVRTVDKRLDHIEKTMTPAAAVTDPPAAAGPPPA